MKIVVSGSESLIQELINGHADIEWIIAASKNLPVIKNVDAYFLLDGITGHVGNLPINKPVFINSVPSTIKEMGAGTNLIRINGWCGFLEKDTWELSGNLNEDALDVLNTMGKKYHAVADEPGFVSARIIAMIINEAYYAKGEGVSTEQAIDVAMKLGTNYPYGPFEWAAIIGKENIYELLLKLSLQDIRYKPAPLLAGLFNN